MLLNVTAKGWRPARVRAGVALDIPDCECLSGWTPWPLFGHIAFPVAEDRARIASRWRFLLLTVVYPLRSPYTLYSLRPRMRRASSINVFRRGTFSPSYLVNHGVGHQKRSQGGIVSINIAFHCLPGGAMRVACASGYQCLHRLRCVVLANCYPILACVSEGRVCRRIGAC